MVATRVVCARFGGEDGRRLGGELAHGLRGWAELRRLYRGRYPLPSPPPQRASPCREGGRTAVVWHFGCFLLLGMNGRSTRVVCFSSVGKQANPAPTLRRFPRKCERIFVGAHPQGEGAERREIGQWLVNGLRVWWAFRRWWWGKPHPTSLYKHRRLYRERYPLPDPPPLRASPCRGGGRTAAGMRAVNVRAERCAEAHPMVVCWVTRCALTQPTRSEWGSCLAFRSSFCRP